MHLVIAMRGNKYTQDRFITELQGKYFPYKTKDGSYAVQMNVQPMTLYSLVFPKESLQCVLNTIQPSSKSWHKYLYKYIALVRRLVGLKPCPEQDKTVLGMPISPHNCELIVLGTKDDDEFKDGELKGGEML
jgi:hypothetical protein